MQLHFYNLLFSQLLSQASDWVHFNLEEDQGIFHIFLGSSFYEVQFVQTLRLHLLCLTWSNQHEFSSFSLRIPWCGHAAEELGSSGLRVSRTFAGPVQVFYKNELHHQPNQYHAFRILDFCLWRHLSVSQYIARCQLLFADMQLLLRQLLLFWAPRRWSRPRLRRIFDRIRIFYLLQLSLLKLEILHGHFWPIWLGFWR